MLFLQGTIAPLLELSRHWALSCRTHRLYLAPYLQSMNSAFNIATDTHGTEAFTVPIVDGRVQISELPLRTVKNNAEPRTCICAWRLK